METGGFSELGGTLTDPDCTRFWHVNHVNVSGVPGRIECQPTAAFLRWEVHGSKTYVLVASCAVLVRFDEWSIDPQGRTFAAGAVVRHASDVPGASRPHEEGCPRYKAPGDADAECECLGGLARCVRSHDQQRR